MPATPRTTRAPRLLLTSLACVLAIVASGCSAEAEDPSTPPTPTATALADIDGLDSLTVQRRDPCAGVAADVVNGVVGEGHGEVATWEPGQSWPGTRHVGDEFGCEVSGPDATARAWVFAPPVTAREARGLVEEATGGKCRKGDGPAYGTPGVAFSCDLNSGESLHGMRGLQGDAWLACEVQGRSNPSTAERWCVAVLGSLTE